MSKNRRIKISNVNGVYLVKIAGGLDIDCLKLQSVIWGLIRRRRGIKILVDLSDVSSIDGAGLGVLVGAFTNASNVEGSLKLIGPTEKMLNLLKLTRLDTLFDIFQNSGLEQAMASFFKKN